MEGSPWLYELTAKPITPSTEQGLSWTVEHRLRESTCHYISDLNRRLALPIITSVTAHMYLNRFYMIHAFQDHDRFLVGATCLFLALKVCECGIKLTDFTERAVMIADHSKTKNAAEVEHVKTKIRQYELILLNTLSYDIVLPNPFLVLASKMRHVEALDPEMPLEDVREFAWVLMLDAFQSNTTLELDKLETHICI
jgi:hypothetical protein